MKKTNSILLRLYDPILIFLFFLGTLLTHSNMKYENEYIRISFLILSNLCFYTYVILLLIIQAKILLKVTIKYYQLQMVNDMTGMTEEEWNHEMAIVNNNLNIYENYLKKINTFYYIMIIMYLQLFYIVNCFIL